MLIIFDIDGTVACIKSRLQIAGDCPDRTDRRAFQQWLDKLQKPEVLSQDKTIGQVALLYQLVKAGPVTTVFLTGRSEQYRAVTAEWLKKNGLHGQVYMRAVTDFRSAAAYKEEQIKKILADYKIKPGFPALAIDDDYDGDCSEMYLRLGLVHLKVIS